MSTYYPSITYAQEDSDPFGEAMANLPVHLQKAVNEDMRLTAEVQASLLKGSVYTNSVRLVLPAAGRLQGMAMLLNCAVTAQHYGVLVGMFVKHLEHMHSRLR